MLLRSSDNKPHKVTVAVLTLEAAFQHYSPVCRTPSAFLQATCVNVTEYTLLPSSQVCVFAGTVCGVFWAPVATQTCSAVYLSSDM